MIYVLQHNPQNLNSDIAPPITFFCNFATDSHQRQRVGASESDFFTKGVIEILSSKVKLRNFDISMEIRLAIAPASVAYTLP